MDEHALIETLPEIMSGEAVFGGSRVPVKTLFDYLKGGDSLEDFLEDFPTVSREQAAAVLELAERGLIDAAVAGRVFAKASQAAPRSA